MVAEYESLRAEILKHGELQFHIIGLTVLTFGTIISVGLQTRNAAIILLHPLLSLILGVRWLDHAHGICRGAKYITQHIETKLGVGYMGWENYVRLHPISGGHISFWGVRAIFPGSSILALLASWMIATLRPVDILLSIFAIAATVGSIAVFIVWSEQSPELTLRPSTG
jgi:hypothetical protein